MLLALSWLRWPATQTLQRPQNCCKCTKSEAAKDHNFGQVLSMLVRWNFDGAIGSVVTREAVAHAVATGAVPLVFAARGAAHIRLLLYLSLWLLLLFMLRPTPA